MIKVDWQLLSKNILWNCKNYMYLFKKAKRSLQKFVVSEEMNWVKKVRLHKKEGNLSQKSWKEKIK